MEIFTSTETMVGPTYKWYNLDFFLSLSNIEKIYLKTNFLIVDVFRKL